MQGHELALTHVGKALQEFKETWQGEQEPQEASRTRTEEEVGTVVSAAEASVQAGVRDNRPPPGRQVSRAHVHRRGPSVCVQTVLWGWVR